MRRTRWKRVQGNVLWGSGNILYLGKVVGFVSQNSWYVNSMSKIFNYEARSKYLDPR